MNFSNMTDSKGVPMPNFGFLKGEIPPQAEMDNQGVAEGLADAAATATSLVMSSNFVLNLLLAISLSRLWSMINA